MCLFVREDDCNCRGGYWRMKCAKSDTVSMLLIQVVNMHVRDVQVCSFRSEKLK